ncbi:DUF6415 family natural product biosynthesis protein [Streptomyces sp. NPDC127033]|uniref:DUF6415 family natural product biosynthesis protein n=1 Tax=Streptomyces sp. NPDC127033 TaxID=3347110 RepID=UPI0036606CB0
MTQPTDKRGAAMNATVTARDIRASIDRGHAVLQGTSDREELMALADELRCHIDVLLPVARVAVDKLWRGGPDWISLTRRLDFIRNQSHGELGRTTLLAHINVRTLALDCEWLLREFGTDLAETEPTR